LERWASTSLGLGEPPPGSVVVLGGNNEGFVAEWPRLLSRWGMSPKLGRVRSGRGVPSRRLSPLSCDVPETLGFNLFIDGILGIALSVGCVRCWEFDEDMLAVLLSELEKPESRDAE
jgi:hypothetical protein